MTRTLGERELNRAVLARQGLLERRSGPLTRVLERVGGLQAQYAPSIYVGLWSRMEGFERDRLTRALERRSVVQATLMRSTIHLVARGDYWPFALATREARRQSWRRATRGAPDMEEAARTLRAALGDGGTIARRDLGALLGKPRAAGVGLWLELVRVPPSGTWERRRADLYAAAQDWLGPPPPGLDARAGEHLVRRYLAGFGPASARDVASYTGLPARALAPVLAAPELRRFRSTDGEELLDLPRAPLPDPDTPVPPRFLPTWDAMLLVHARRSGILPEEHRPAIFNTRNPHSLPTFLVDGRVAGTWRAEGGGVRLDPFGRLDSATRRALGEEADRLAAFHA